MFKDIPGFSNYQINEQGEVRSVSRSVVRNDGKTQDYSSQTLKPYLKKGKPYVQLYQNGRKKCLSVSSLLALTFSNKDKNDGET